MSRHLLLFFLGIVLASNGWCQKEGNVWYLGTGVTVDFNDTVPVVLKPSKEQAYEAASSLSDVDGNLIIASNNERLFDSAFDTVTGWQPISGTAGISVSEGSIFLPLNDSLIMSLNLVHYDQSITLKCYLEYSLLRQGDTSITIISQHNFVRDSMTEKMIAIRHANGSSWWIITHEAGTDQFVTLQIDSLGNFVQSSQAVGRIHSHWHVLNWKFYPGGSSYNSARSLIAMTGSPRQIDIFRFDRCKGLLSPYSEITESGSWPFAFYDCQFSPNGKILYVGEVNYTGVQPPKLYQFVMDSGVTDSVIVLHQATGSTPEMGDLKLTPAGEIAFVPDLWGQYLGLIKNPDSVGMSCDVDLKGISLQPTGQVMYALPNSPDYSLGPVYSQPANAGPDQLLCTKESTTLGTPDTTGKSAFFWSPATGLDDSTKAQPTMTDVGYDITYVLTVVDTSISSECNTTTDTVRIFHEDPPQIQPDEDHIHCPAGDTWIGIAHQDGLTYSWDPTFEISHPDSSRTMVRPKEDTEYILTITDTTLSERCGPVYDTINVTVNECPYPNIISPNGDGINDFFVIDGLPLQTHFQVFDRWGRQLYHTFEYNNDWPQNSGDLKPGVYFIQIEFELEPPPGLQREVIDNVTVVK